MNTIWLTIIVAATVATVLLNIYFWTRGMPYGQQYVTVIFALFMVVPVILFASESDALTEPLYRLNPPMRTAWFGLAGGWLARAILMMHDLQSNPKKVGSIDVIVIRLLLSAFAGLVATLLVSIFPGFSHLSHEMSMIAGLAGGTLGAVILRYAVTMFDAWQRWLRTISGKNPTRTRPPAPPPSHRDPPEE
jgi:hypothetical protein